MSKEDLKNMDSINYLSIENVHNEDNLNQMKWIRRSNPNSIFIIVFWVRLRLRHRLDSTPVYPSVRRR